MLGFFVCGRILPGPVGLVENKLRRIVRRLQNVEADIARLANGMFVVMLAGFLKSGDMLRFDGDINNGDVHK